MKISILIAALLGLGIAGCTPEAAEHHSPVGIGGGGIPNQWLPPANPVTGSSATIVVFDTTVTPSHADRLVVSAFANQAVTILYRVQHNGSATWRTVNGSGDSVTASTQTKFEYPVVGLNSQLEIVTGVTGPTVSEFDIGLMYERCAP